MTNKYTEKKNRLSRWKKKHTISVNTKLLIFTNSLLNHILMEMKYKITTVTSTGRVGIQSALKLRQIYVAVHPHPSDRRPYLRLSLGLLSLMTILGPQHSLAADGKCLDPLKGLKITIRDCCYKIQSLEENV